MIIGNQSFERTDHTYVMGILNVTPDSFADGGKYTRLEQALLHAKEMIAAGVDIIDIGGQSTRPGYEMVSNEEEIYRIAPVIEKIKREYNIPVSLDTYKPKVARVGIEAGADMINDIWSLQYDEAMGKVIAETGVAYCMMHNPKDPVQGLTIEILLEQMREDLQRALDAGICKERIILDPGIGFAKTQEENLMAIANAGRLKELGYPVLLGASRKSVVDYVLHLPVSQRLEGTLAITADAVAQRIPFVRVHDVEANVRMIAMAEAIRDRREEETEK